MATDRQRRRQTDEARSKATLEFRKNMEPGGNGVASIHLISAYPIDRERFIRMCAEGLGDMIDAGQWDGDWFFQLDYWLPQIVAIANKLYSSEVGAIYIPEDDPRAQPQYWGQIVHSVMG
jgi:hypothetical protein